MARKKQASRHGRTRSAIIVRITILVSAVIILSAMLTILLVRNSQRNLADKCTDCLLQTVAQNVSNSYNYIAHILMPGYVAQSENLDMNEFASAMLHGEINGVQDALNHDLARMLDAGYLGLDMFMVVIPPSTMIKKPMVWACDEPELVYNWEVPGYMTSAIEEDAPYLWMEEGVPELNLSGGYLVTQGKVENPLIPGLVISYFGFRPMQEEMDAARSFFDDKEKSANITLVLVMAGFMLAVLLVIFLLLNRLIKKRVIGPIDELSAAAEEVMQGNLDVDIRVREGDEFVDLKYAFKEMIQGLRGYIARSVGEEYNGREDDAEKRPLQGRRKSSILWQIVFVLVIMLFVYGIAAFFVLRSSQESLIDHGTERLLQTEADNFISSLDYAIQLELPAYVESFASTDLKTMFADLDAERLSDLQRELDASMQEMVKAGFHGLEKVMLVVPSSSVNPETIIWACNDESLIYEWQCPHYFDEALQDGTTYMLMPDGIPELGLSGEYLVTFIQVDNPLIPTMPFYYIALKPMSLELAAIDEFCDKERARANLFLASILEGSIILVIIILFLLLNHMINKQIVHPAEELSQAARKVMEGDLDVAVSVHEGEELEGLKRAFNEMVASLRDMLSKSVEAGTDRGENL
ncbi:MAG: HAMP domain-containing protein [Actinobacteria bacterium]|nr:HAMP domain-containing protein [Actinomycetota bacterium]